MKLTMLGCKDCHGCWLGLSCTVTNVLYDDFSLLMARIWAFHVSKQLQTHQWLFGKVMKGSKEQPLKLTGRLDSHSCTLSLPISWSGSEACPSQQSPTSWVAENWKKIKSLHCSVCFTYSSDHSEAKSHSRGSRFLSFKNPDKLLAGENYNPKNPQPMVLRAGNYNLMQKIIVQIVECWKLLLIVLNIWPSSSQVGWHITKSKFLKKKFRPKMCTNL